MRPLIGCAMALALCATGATAAPAADPEGDWAGWAYFDDGSDAPLRLRVESVQGELVARFDELVRRAYDLPARIEVGQAPAVVVERVRPLGGAIRLVGRIDGDAWTGTLRWVDAGGRFELARSPRPIARLAPETFADAVGAYRLGDDHLLVVQKRAWGELTYADLATGRQGTLFPNDRDEFWVGPAQYVPGPVEALVRFERDAGGTVVALRWTDAAGAVARGPRAALVEEELGFERGGVTFHGTLLHLPGATPRATAIVLPGSNWKTRDAARNDAGALAALGVAAFTFDRRGNGASGGDPVHALRDDAEDALAAAAMLARRPDVDPARLGITGRSQGGWIAPLAASLSPALRWVLLFVPPAMTPADQEHTRRANALADGSFDAAARELGEQLFARSLAYAERGTGWDAYAALRARAVALGFPDDLLEAATPDDPDWTWGKLNWRFDPLPALARVRQPLLAFFGGADRNVVPELNLPPMRAALTRAGNPDFSLRVLAGANHGLVAIPAAERGLPYHRHSGVGPQPWSQIAAWLASHGLADGGPAAPAAR